MRNRLMNSLQMQEKPLNEHRGILHKELQKELEDSAKACIVGLKTSIAVVEKKISSLLKEDKSLSIQQEIITSLPGVGTITACGIITSSDEFKRISTARQYACYAGIAPFDHSSGSSVRGGSHVSPQANKTIKYLLHMCAMSAIRMKGHYKEYYERKVKEGKPKMLVLNAIRNKMVRCMYSCIKSGKHYVAPEQVA